MRSVAFLFLFSCFLTSCQTYGPYYLGSGVSGERLEAADSRASLWWTSSGWKVGPTEAVPATQGGAIRLSAARNETEAVQLIIRPQEKLSGLMARGARLRGPRGAAIGAENVEVLRVRYVNVVQATDAAGSTGPWPDPLPPFKGPIDLEPDRNQPLWIRIHVPTDAPAGDYKGEISLTADGGWSVRVALRLHVYDFTLPDRMTCVTAFGFSPENVWRYQKIDDPAQRRTVLDRYWANFSAHHISPYYPAPLDPIKVRWPETSDPKLLRPVFDWSAWDRAMETAIDGYHFNSFRLSIPGMGGGTFYSRNEPTLLGYAEDTPQYRAAFNAYVGAMQEHLRAKGWLDEAYIYWFDEPDPKDYAFVMNGFRKLKEAAPEIPRMLTEQPEAELAGGPDIWCVLSENFIPDRAKERRSQGDRFWWYVCTAPKTPYAGLFIDRPATDLRVWLWQTWRNGLNGILVWKANYWTSTAAFPDADHPQNPYEDPMGWTQSYGLKPGERRPWGNGDGRFIYPPEAAADAHPAAPVLEGPVDSIRWEALRDGIEDYEYLAMLRRLLETKGGDIDAERRGRFEALLEVPDSISASMKQFTRDPAPIERRRDEIARAVAALSQL